MAQLEITSTWKWNPNCINCILKNLIGGTMPDQIRSAIRQDRIQLPNGSDCWELGDRIANYLLGSLEEPPPIDIGLQDEVHGQIHGPSALQPEGRAIQMLYWAVYPNAFGKRRLKCMWQVEELPRTIRGLVDELDRRVQRKVEEYFFSNYSDGEIDQEKWTRKKAQVFICYRSHHCSTGAFPFCGLYLLTCGPIFTEVASQWRSSHRPAL